MRKILCVFLPMLLSCSPYLYGSGASSTTRPTLLNETCLSEEQYIKTRKALSRCKKWKKKVPKLEKEIQIEKLNSLACDAANKKLWADLKQCRKERDNPPRPPSKFWVGVAWGAGTTTVAIVVISGVIFVVVLSNGKR